MVATRVGNVPTNTQHNNVSVPVHVSLVWSECKRCAFVSYIPVCVVLLPPFIILGPFVTGFDVVATFRFDSFWLIHARPFNDILFLFTFPDLALSVRIHRLMLIAIDVKGDRIGLFAQFCNQNTPPTNEKEAGCVYKKAKGCLQDGALHHHRARFRLV